MSTFFFYKKGYFIAAVLWIGFLIMAAMFYQSIAADSITTSSMAVVMVIGFGFSVLLKGRFPILLHGITLAGMASVFAWLALHPQEYNKPDSSDIIVAGITYGVKLRTCFEMKLFLGWATALLFVAQTVLAQRDSLIMKNDDVIVGELKDLDKGVAVVETNYSDADFKIEWKGLKEIYTTSYFLITLSSGERYNGKLNSKKNGKVKIITQENDSLEHDLIDIVFLKSVKPGFWQKFKANIDVDLSRTKANDLRQLSVHSMVSYLSERWSADATYNTLFSSQDSIESISRTDGALNYRYYLQKDWFLIASISFLSNSEQKLDLRTNQKVGLGKYLIHSNHTYWAFMGGLAYNYEEYSTETDVRKTWEGFFGSELNIYDIGDLNLFTKIIVSPSLTESGRWRTDFNFNAKYDLPLDFYIRLGYTLNFDNRPVEGGARSDYIINGGFGWEW